jgi:hypothetical protein
MDKYKYNTILLDNMDNEDSSTASSELKGQNVSSLKGRLGDENKYTKKIRRYANEVVNGNRWPIEKVNLSKVTFEIRKKARKRHGVADYGIGKNVTIGISEHTIENAGFEAVKRVIRHELVHVWQRQNMLSDKDEIKLPNGETVRDVKTGHTGCWSEWEDLMDVSRTDTYYEKSPEDYNYQVWCHSCQNFIIGRYRMCKTIKHHSESLPSGFGWCTECDEGGSPGSTFVVVSDDKYDEENNFYSSVQHHNEWDTE